MSLLSDIAEEDDSIMEILGETNNIEVFQTKVVTGLLHFKWNKYAGRVHKLSASTHIIYILMFIVYP